MAGCASGRAWRSMATVIAVMGLGACGTASPTGTQSQAPKSSSRALPQPQCPIHHGSMTSPPVSPGSAYAFGRRLIQAGYSNPQPLTDLTSANSSIAGDFRFVFNFIPYALTTPCYAADGRLIAPNGWGIDAVSLAAWDRIDTDQPAVVISDYEADSSASSYMDWFVKYSSAYNRERGTRLAAIQCGRWVVESSESSLLPSRTQLLSASGGIC